MTGNNGNGGGVILISDQSTVTITDSTISTNRALNEEANVGGIEIHAITSTIEIDELKVVGNHADDDLGGLFIANVGSTVTLRNSTISGNTARHNGHSEVNAAGGVWLEASSGGTTTIENSTIADNKIITDPMDPSRIQNVSGGGLFALIGAGTTTTIRNSTISGNHAEGFGGGIEIRDNVLAGGQVNILNSTITNNRANSDNDSVGTGGGIHILGSGTAVTIENTIVAGNFRGTGATRDDISGALEAAFSLIGDNTGATITDNGGNIIGTGTMPIAPGLAALADNGGPTPTHALLPGSRAIDAGSNSLAANAGLTTDQRGAGFPRSFDIPSVTVSGAGPVDIGAFELGAVRVTNVTISGSYSTHPKYSFNGPDDKLDADGSGKQLVTVPVGFANTVELTFSANVNASLQPNHLFIRGLLFGASPSLAANGFSYDTFTNTAKWVYSIPSFPTDQYVISLSDTFTDPYGLKLDGEWTNPKFTWTVHDAVSEFPSGNGTAGGRFTFVFTNLHGDANQDNVVDALDQAIYAANLILNPQNATFAQGDFNGSGTVTTLDGQAITINMNVNLQGLVWADFTADSLVTTSDEEVLEDHNGQSVSNWHLGDVNGDGVVDYDDFDLYNMHGGFFVQTSTPLKITIAPW